MQHPATSSGSPLLHLLLLLLLLRIGSGDAIPPPPPSRWSSGGQEATDLGYTPAMAIVPPGHYDEPNPLFWDLMRKYTGANFFVAPDTSPACANHTTEFLREIGQLRPWALQMLDASAKIPSGILEGNFAWWGSFPECLDTTVYLDSTAQDAEINAPDFVGQYCTLSLKLNTSWADPNATNKILEFLNSFNLNLADSSKLGLSVGLCIPSTCTTDDIQKNVQHIVDLMNVPVQAETQTCQDRNSYHLDSASIAVICLWGSFGLLILLGTSYELVTILNKRCWCIRQMKSEHTLPESPSMNPLYCSHSEENLTKNGKWSGLFMSFSIITNGSQILNVGETETRGHLSALHGLRFLSMAWIILGHTYYVAVLNAPMWDNVKQAAIVSRDFAFQIILRGVLGVDTFLFLSGLLVVYVSLKKMKASDGKLNIGMFYLHRLIRLSPVYMMTIAWVAGPSDYVMPGGPLWPQVAKYKTDCQHTWWKSMLYISNFGNTAQMCVPHSWYISLDTQMYVFTPLLLYPLYRFPRLGVALTVLCIAASCTTAGVISYIMSLPSSTLVSTVSVETLIAYSTEFYIKPYCRLGPYGVGMLVGYLLVNEDIKNRIKPSVAYLLWCIAVACNLSVLYAAYGQFLSTEAPPALDAAIYNAISGTVWALGIGWLTLACVHGYGGFINKILSWRAWIPLSRLTYCAYLLHMIVLYTFFGSRNNKFHFDQILMVTIYLGILVLTFGISFLFSLVFESPFVQLEKFARERFQTKAVKITSRYGTS